MGLMLKRLYPDGPLATGYEQQIAENAKIVINTHPAYGGARDAKAVGTKSHLRLNIVRHLCKALERADQVMDRGVDPDARLYIASPLHVNVPGAHMFECNTDGDYHRIMKNVRQFVREIRAEFGDSAAQTGWAIAFLMPEGLDVRTRVALHRFRKEATDGKIGLHVILVDMRSQSHLLK